MTEPPHREAHRLIHADRKTLRYREFAVSDQQAAAVGINGVFQPQYIDFEVYEASNQTYVCMRLWSRKRHKVQPPVEVVLHLADWLDFAGRLMADAP